MTSNKKTKKNGSSIIGIGAYLEPHVARRDIVVIFWLKGGDRLVYRHLIHGP